MCGVSWTFPGAVGRPQPPVSQCRGAVQALMSTLAACEADEALSDVGDSRGCPGEGFAFALLFGFGVWCLTAEIRALCAAPCSCPHSYREKEFAHLPIIRHCLP